VGEKMFNWLLQKNRRSEGKKEERKGMKDRGRGTEVGLKIMES
jgi:hypothetical protein